jgi:hypothetical protein
VYLDMKEHCLGWLIPWVVVDRCHRLTILNSHLSMMT